MIFVSNINQIFPALCVPKHVDSLLELLRCVKLYREVQSLPSETQLSTNQTQYKDIFVGVVKQKQPTDTYKILLKLGEKLLFRDLR